MRIIATAKPIHLKVDELELELKPLNFKQKQELWIQYREELETEYPERALDLLNRNAMKMSIKSVKGLIDQDGEEWVPSFDEEMLSDESLDDLLGIEVKDKLVLAVTAFLNGFPKDGEIKDPMTGKLLEGVTIGKKPSDGTKKK